VGGVEKMEMPPALQARQVYGIIVVGGQTDRVMAQLCRRQLPVAVIDRFRPEGQSDLGTAIKHLFQPHLSSQA
jgi:hypothetical protein